MNCPKCAGELRQWTQKNITHHYCPSCHPGYADTPSALETVGAIGVMIVSVVLYPLLYCYLRLRGESF